jgi:hypothetical protein
VRVYVPATSEVLRGLLDDGALAAGQTAFAVTPGLRHSYRDDDIEELEYAALLEAARASLRLLDDDRSAARRRAVVAADVSDAQVSVRDDLERGVVRLGAPVPVAQIASVHVDDRDAEAAVDAAAGAIMAADLGSDSAQDIVDDAEGFELQWYATQEIQALLESM